MIDLGSKVKDRITGFRGVATVRADYLNGSVRIGIQGPMTKDGKIPDLEWVDESQMDVEYESEKAKKMRIGGPAGRLARID